MKSVPTLVIMGRPNVGKSTLFNRLLGSRRALVHDLPGVTRDRVEAEATWWIQKTPRRLKLVDTGGLGGERFAAEIERQVETGLSSADIALMVFDARTGLTHQDQELIRKFNESGLFARVPVIAVINKVDDNKHEALAGEFYGVGIETLLTISAEHGRGIDDLQAAVAELLGDKLGVSEEDLEPVVDEFDDEKSPSTEERKPAEFPRVAIIGRPNVGKSTLLNALIGEERMITSPIAGTTVDAVDSVIELGDQKFTFIDTAGIRRKSKTEQGIEVLSVVQARKALERADVAVLMLDGEGGVTDQDEKISSLIEEFGTAVVLAVNKWDTQRNTKGFTKEIAAEAVRKNMGHMAYAPILFMSAKEGKGFEDLGELIQEILHQRSFKVTTHEFSEWVRKEATIHNPANVKFFMCHQSGRYPPTFVCHVSDPEKVDFSMKRHLINALRARWGFMGSPVRLLFLKAKRKNLPPKVGKPRSKAKMKK